MSSVIAALAQTPMSEGLLGGAMEPFDSEFVLLMGRLPGVGPVHADERDVLGRRRALRPRGGRCDARLDRGGEMPSAEELVKHVAEIRGEEDHVLRSSAVAEAELARSLA